jgi:hypothetical protein
MGEISRPRGGVAGRPGASRTGSRLPRCARAAARALPDLATRWAAWGLCSARLGLCTARPLASEGRCCAGEERRGRGRGRRVGVRKSERGCCSVEIEKKTRILHGWRWRNSQWRRPSLGPRKNLSIDGDLEVQSMNRTHCNEVLDKTNVAVPSDSADDAQIGNNCSP